MPPAEKHAVPDAGKLTGSNKIMIKDGAIIWISAGNPKLEKLLEESTRLL